MLCYLQGLEKGLVTRVFRKHRAAVRHTNSYHLLTLEMCASPYDLNAIYRIYSVLDLKIV